MTHHTAVELALSVLVSTTAVPSLANVQPAAVVVASAPSPEVKTSSAWLRSGAAHQQKGEHAQAGAAYRKALEALSPQKQRANEGARAAMLSADTYWQAYEHDLDAAHLQAAIEVLELWRTLAGPQSRESLRGDVEQMTSRILAILEPLGKADTALGADDVSAAAEHYRDLLDALASQGRDWSLGARLVLSACLRIEAAYAEHVERGGDVAAHLHELHASRELLEGWRRARPAGDASVQGPAVEQALARVAARIAEAEQTMAGAQGRAGAAAMDAERAPADAAERARTQAEAAERARRAGIGLTTVGAIAVSTGAGLLGLGLRESFSLDDDTNPRSDEAPPRGGLWAGSGALLLVGGVVAVGFGLEILVQSRRARGVPRRARVRPGPFIVAIDF